MMRLRERVWILALLVLLVVCGVVLSLVFCDWPETFWDWFTNGESGSSTIRNLGLVLAGIIALPLAIWRGVVADRQASAAQRQAETALEQANIAQRSLLNERYQQGAEMLGNNVLSVRLGGIYGLRRLAQEHPEEYHVQIMELLCAFVCHPTKDGRLDCDLEGDEDQDEQMRKIRKDVEDAMRTIGSRSVSGIALEQSKNFTLYLHSADVANLEVQDAILSGAKLTKANLSGAILPRANLSGARLRWANLSRAQLRKADLSNGKLWGADLSKAILRDANLSGADLCGVTVKSSRYKRPVEGLTQSQLETACADPHDPPTLDGVLDAETGEPLVWRGKSCGG